MTNYELLSILISVLATVISMVVWTGQRKLQREANELQRATAELAKKQLEIIQREELAKNAASLAVILERTGGSHKFRVSNVGGFEARDIQLLFVFVKPEHNPLIASEYAEKFPAAVLAPGDSISLIAALDDDSPTAYNVMLKWKNPDGSTRSQQAYVAL